MTFQIRSRATSRLYAVIPCIGVMVLAACSDNPAAPYGHRLLLSPALVSAPFAESRASAAAVPATIAYISMAPGTIPGGTTVTVRHMHASAVVSAVMVNGGFDPIAVPAHSGDTLLVTAVRLRGDTSGYVSVPPASVPQIVRVSPANQKTNVALNGVVLIVFSEPMIGSTLIRAIGVTRSGLAILGTVVPGAIDTLSATFEPASLLAPATSYQIQVSTAARAQNGDSLTAPLQSTFTTTGPSDSAACAHNCWIGLDSMPGVVASWGAGVVNGIIYQVAEYTGGLQGLSAYDPDSNRWTAKAMLPTQDQVWPAVGVLNGLVFAVGGEDHDGNPSGEVEAYDPAANRWARRASLPVPGFYSTLGVLQGALYIANASGNTAAYDPTTDHWTTKASVPGGDEGDVMIDGGGVIDGVLYAVRGRDLCQPCPDSGGAFVFAYDPVANTWTRKAPGTPFRTMFGVGVLNNNIYAVGGVDYEWDPQSTVEAYDPASNSWTTKAPLPAGASSAQGIRAVAVVGGKLYSIQQSDQVYRP